MRHVHGQWMGAESSHHVAIMLSFLKITGSVAISDIFMTTIMKDGKRGISYYLIPREINVLS